MTEHHFTPDSSDHSSVVGGSTANRRIMCPGSYQLEQKLPAETKDEESSYAAEGTALHEAIAYILDNDLALEQLDQMVGKEFYGHTLDRTLVADALVPAVEFFDKLVDISNKEGGLDFELEKRCQFPLVPNAFGTSDLVGRTNKRSIILDWKFGAGKPVYAWKEVPEGTPGARKVKMPQSELEVNVIGNPQLMFYGRAAMFQLPDMFEQNDDWPVELFIVQPRISDELGGAKISRHTTTVGELKEFGETLKERVELAMTKDAPLAKRKGDHCNWCRCQTICPLWTGPVLDLTRAYEASELEMKRTDKMPVEEYAELLGHYMDLFDAIEEIQSEAQLAAVNLLEQGVDVPGWCLKPKRAGHDKWKDDDKAEAYLGRQGVALHERRITKVMTPAAARKALKALGKELKESYVEPGVSSGYTLGRTETTKDPIKIRSAAEIANKLAAIGQS